MTSTTFDHLVMGKFKPDILIWLGGVDFTQTQQNADEQKFYNRKIKMFPIHFIDCITKYVYFNKIEAASKCKLQQSENFVDTDHMQSKMPEIFIDDDFIGFKTTIEIKYSAVREILIQLYNGVRVATSAVPFTDTKWNIRIVLIITCICITHKLTIHDLTDHYITLLLNTLAFENLFSVAEDIKYFPTGSIMVNDFGVDNIYLDISFDKSNAKPYAKFPEFCFCEKFCNFVIKIKDGTETFSSKKLFSLNKTPVAQELKKQELKKIIPIRANHRKLFCIDNEMYAELCKIFAEKHVTYDKKLLEMLVIPTIGTTDFGNSTSIVNLATYVELTK